MYSTCLYCNATLGRNEVVERFPVGRRLAFDAARGRLWAVCPACARWNLTPVEERWEAIESCERLFRDTRLRASTDNIGLARVREGLELVRIGQPQRPEFAAWRYGREFQRRFRRSIAIQIGVGTIPTLAVALKLVHPVFLSVIPAAPLLQIPLALYLGERARRRPVARLSVGDGQTALIRGRDVRDAHILAGELPGEWGLRVRHERGVSRLQGTEATRVLGRALAVTNDRGATRKETARALERLSAATSANDYIARMALHLPPGAPAEQLHRHLVVTNSIAGQVQEVGLALEMALHEETERAAMDGELTALEDAWKEAEEIAAIADDLLLPDSITQRLSDLRTKGHD